MIKFSIFKENTNVTRISHYFNYLWSNTTRYCLIRLGGIQEKGTLKTTLRDIFICHIGKDVGIIEKGKKTAFLGDAQAYLQVCSLSFELIYVPKWLNIFQPFHSDITVLNKDKVTNELVLDRSHPLSGSHVID